jgi:peptidyl-prolyl cis-trans isomerase B (cyclophilin B)
VAPRANDKDARVQRERARAYQARVELNAGRQRRRTRDNVIGGIVGAVVLLGILGAQVAYYTAGPGKPAPSPSPTVTSTVTPTPEATDAATPAPTTTP